jgi:signal transduction histidine kinase/ligand-binding sensor domain-containing protein
MTFLKIIRLSLFFSMILTKVSGQTREILFDQIRKDDGVLHRVFDLIQDHKGFIWFRTAGNTGIQRYDGYKFETFLDSAGFFNSIMEDQKGLLWLGSSTGVTVFNPVNEKSVQYYIHSKPQNSHHNITEIIQDHKGDYWCATGNGILKFTALKCNPTGLIEEIFENGIASAFEVSVIMLNSKDSTSGTNYINKIYEDSKKRLWIGGNGCVYLLEPTTGALERIDGDVNGKTRLSDPFISSIIEENPDVFWIGTGNGACRISNVDKAFTQDGMDKYRLFFKQFLQMKLITGILKGDRNTLWIGTYLNGLIQMKYDKTGKPEFREIYTDVQDPEGEGIRTIFTLMKDRTGLIWTGHQFGGIRKFDPYGNNFTSYKELIRKHFSHYDLNPIYKDAHGNLWIGTMGGGLYQVARNGKVFNYYITDDAIPGKSGNGILSLLEIENGIFWIGAANGIWQFNARTGKSIKLFTNKEFGDLNNYSYDMLRFNNFILFTIWGEGLFLYNLQTRELSRYSYDPNVVTGIKSNIIYTLCKSGDSEFYAGGINGLTRFRINEETGKLVFLDPHFPELKNINEPINAIYSDQSGVLWCGTNTGLLKFNLLNGRRVAWGEKEGSTIHTIRAMEQDDQGKLWLGTSNGLSVLDTTTGKIGIFNKNHGLPVEIHGHHSSFKDQRGELYFGGIGGFYSFRPDSMKTNQSVPPIVITDFRLFNKSVIPSGGNALLTNNISYTDNLKLRYNQNDITFAFAALDYCKSSANRYAYRLNGYQKEWIETDADNRIAAYTNLNPGSYILEVKGSNNNGVWNDRGTSIQILIRPPFWKTTIAYISYAVMLLLVLRGYIYWRTWSLRKEKALLEQQVKERTHVIEDQKEELLQQKEELQTTLENLRKTQEQLIESEKMAALGGLVAGVAHEINTPVGIGITAITTLLDDVKKTADSFIRNEISRGDFKEFLQTTYDAGELIQKNLERTASLIQSFKQVSVDQVTEQQRVFKIKSYLQDIISSLQPKLKQKDIRLIIACDDKLELNSFPGVFAQIFTNLMLNSLQHGFPDTDTGTININVQLNSEMLHILYSDDGRGISSKDLPRIFEPFYTTDLQKGLGLGLNIVYNLVRQKLQGFISCNSEPGMGALFKMDIPVK